MGAQAGSFEQDYGLADSLPVTFSIATPPKRELDSYLARMRRTSSDWGGESLGAHLNHDVPPGAIVVARGSVVAEE